MQKSFLYLGDFSLDIADISWFDSNARLIGLKNGHVLEVSGQSAREIDAICEASAAIDLIATKLLDFRIGAVDRVKVSVL